MRTDRYKLILTIPPEEVARNGRGGIPAGALGRELYDLREDPAEKRNLLLSSPVPQAVVTDLEARLRRYAAEHRGASDKAELSAEAVERLRALGYIR